jgi:cell filamentation protein
MDDPYCYAGTRILRNQENIRDEHALEEFERRSARNRAETLPQDIPITADGFRQIHRLIFQDIYDWAGKDRTIDIAGHGTFFPSVEQIGDALNDCFGELNVEDNLRHLLPERFAARAAEFVCALNKIHPFRDGNGRTVRAFLQILALQAGHPIDLARVDPRAWNTASRESDYLQDSGPMREVIRGALVEQAPEIERNATPPDVQD